MVIVVNSKKGVIFEGKTVVYIIAGILAVLFLVFGYRMIGSIGEKGEQAFLVKFKSELEKDIGSVGFDIGSVKIEKYGVPSTFDEICFVDLRDVVVSYLGNYSIIQDSVESGANKNVFLMGEGGFETMYIEDLGVFYWPHYSCLSTRTGIIELEIEGVGHGAAVKVMEREYCNNAEILDMCLGLDTVFCPDYKEECGYRAKCCEKYNLCC